MMISSSKVPHLLSVLKGRLFDSTPRLPLACTGTLAQFLSSSTSGCKGQEGEAISLRGLPTADQIKAAFDAYAAVHPDALEEPPKRELIKVTPYSLFQKMNIKRITALREKELEDGEIRKSRGFGPGPVINIVTRQLFDKLTPEELEKLKLRCARNKALSKILRRPMKPCPKHRKNPNYDDQKAEYKSYSAKWCRVRGELGGTEELLRMFEEELEDILQTDVYHVAVTDPEYFNEHRSRWNRFKHDIRYLERFLGMPIYPIKNGESNISRRNWRRNQRKPIAEIRRLEKELWDKYERDLEEWEERMAADGHRRFIANLREEMASHYQLIENVVRRKTYRRMARERELDAQC